jgi:hypothetical protein
VYYDDVFLEANFNPAPAGPAYVDDSGTLRAGVSLWAWRDFLRRSATLQHTIDRFHGRKPTVLYIHMTNVNMIPLLSWGSVNLDWEWRPSAADVQTRNYVGCDHNGLQCNDTSFILAQTTGLQSGNIPVAISSGLRGPNCTERPDLGSGTNCTAWLIKTQYATCIPHEVRPAGTPYGQTTIPASPDGEFEETPTTNNISKVLDVYGYGDPTCDVYRFWEPGFPIQTSGANVLCLVVHCPSTSASAQGAKGHVLVFVSSFGPKGPVNFELAPPIWSVDAGTSATNVESGAPIDRVPNSKNFSFSLDRHSFKVVVIKTDDDLVQESRVDSATKIHSEGNDISVVEPPLIVLASDAPAVEQQAAKLLANWCGKLHFGERGAFGTLPIVTPAVAAKAKNKTQFVVGASGSAALGILASDLTFDKLGGDGFVLTSNRTALLRSAAAGSFALSGAPNSTGTIYAAQHLLRLLGIKFLAWDETLLPAAPIPNPYSNEVDLTFVPHFEYRNTYGWASEATPAIHQLFHQTKSPYASPPGMVHTSYSLFGPAHPPASGKSKCDAQQCPPADLFKQHPEWFWPRGNGKSYGQLCWSNASMIDFIAERAAEMLAKQPNAKVISMSQNDNGNCE